MTRVLPSRWTQWVLAAVAAFGVITMVVVYDRLYRDAGAPYFESDEDHFLYGSIGAESIDGIPYWVWLVLPRIFPDLLPAPGGYAALGVLTRDGAELPVGISKVTIGYPRVATNCAFCHTASVRTGPDALPAVVPGAPAHQLAAQAYVRFLTAAAADARFNAGAILGEIARNTRLPLVDRLLYRFVVIPGTRQRLLRLAERGTWMSAHADWGRGRADVLSPLKYQRLGRAGDDTVGTADIMPLWGLAQREKNGLFWDASSGTLRDAVVVSALSAGASRSWLDNDVGRWDDTDPRTASSLRRVQNYMLTLEPPPFPFAIDTALAATGEAVYQAECAQCHAAGVPRPDVPGTDTFRQVAWTGEAAVAFDAFAARRDWRTPGFRTGSGYVPVPLEGLWLRAPYLHNGSVPSLSDLLEPPPNRPVRFWRGHDVYDPLKVGFVSDGDAQRTGTLFDTSQPGNGNAGHTYGTALPAESRRALLEYLKTL